ncbi:MAG: hypothetical protein R3F14_13985 [Polyangiaceae bacterium]
MEQTAGLLAKIGFAATQVEGSDGDSAIADWEAVTPNEVKTHLVSSGADHIELDSNDDTFTIKSTKYGVDSEVHTISEHLHLAGARRLGRQGQDRWRRLLLGDAGRSLSSRIRATVFELNKLPEDTRNLFRPMTEALDDLAGILSSTAGVIESALAFVTPAAATLRASRWWGRTASRWARTRRWWASPARGSAFMPRARQASSIRTTSCCPRSCSAWSTQPARWGSSSRAGISSATEPEPGNVSGGESASRCGAPPWCRCAVSAGPSSSPWATASGLGHGDRSPGGLPRRRGRRGEDSRGHRGAEGRPGGAVGDAHRDRLRRHGLHRLRHPSTWSEDGDGSPPRGTCRSRPSRPPAYAGEYMMYAMAKSAAKDRKARKAALEQEKTDKEDMIDENK